MLFSPLSSDALTFLPEIRVGRVLKFAWALNNQNIRIALKKILSVQLSLNGIPFD